MTGAALKPALRGADRPLDEKFRISMIALHAELARHVLLALPRPLALLDPVRRVVWANDAFARLVERPAERCVGATLEDLALRRCSPPAIETQRLSIPGFRGFLAIYDGDAEVENGGLLSRAAILRRLDAEISRSRRYANPLSCLLARVTGGVGAHAALERMLRDQLRWVDVLARWSDDELLVLLPETPARAAAALCRKLALRARTLDGVVAVAWGTSTWRRGDDAAGFVARGRRRGAAWSRTSAPLRAQRQSR